MTAIFTGLGAGFERGSGSVIGSGGLLGSSTLGRGGEQLFLNAATGNFMVSQRDEFLVGLGLDASVSRTYNSLGDLSDENQDNWRQSTDRRIYGLTGTINTVGSTVKRVSADGSEITYTHDGTAYVATDGGGAYDKLAFNAATNEWTWTDGDTQVTETYAANGAHWLITKQTDTDGNSLTWSYLADGKLYRVTTQDGSYVQYNWSGNNITEVVTGYTDLATSTAKTLTRTRYAYDAQNRLSSVVVDLSPSDNSIADGATYTTTYTYDGTSKRVASISQTDGSHIAITYDGSNRVSTLVQTSATGVTRTSSLTYGAGYTNVTDPLGNVARLDYNADGSLKKITMPPATSGGSAQVVEFAYNGYGDLTSVTDALTNATSFAYDSNGNVISTTDRLGNVTTRTYGAKNELLTETTTSSDAASSAAAHTVRYAYDSENHLRYRVSAEGHVTEYRYHGASEHPSHVIDYPEHFYNVTSLASGAALTESQLDSWRNNLGDKSSTHLRGNLYDARGNLTQSFTTPTDATGSSADIEQIHTYFVYDQAGNLRSRYTQGRNIETFVYDGLGRMVSSVDVHGGTTSFVFNDAASKTIVTLASGLIQTSTYNKAGELVDFTESTVAGGLAAATGTATYGYDKNGRLRWQVDASGRKSYFVYDQLGRKVADISALGNVIEYRYDANDRLVARVQYDLVVSSSTLTSLNDENAVIDMAAIRPPANDDLWSWNVYDKEGRLVQTIDGLGLTTIHTYDGAGRLVRSTSYANNVATATVQGFKTTPPTGLTYPWPIEDPNNRVSRTFYDKDGRLLGSLNGDGFVTKILYDKAGQRTDEIAYVNASTATYRASGTFDQLLSTVAAHADDRRTRYVYDAHGQLRFVVDAKFQVTETRYDNAGQATTAIAYSTAISSSTTNFTHNNLKALVGGAGFATSNDRWAWSVYDAAGRVAQTINGYGLTTVYTYNSAGLLTKTVSYANNIATATVENFKTTPPTNVTYPYPVEDVNNRVTRYFYDKSGVLRYTVDAEGHVSRIDVDAEGRETHRVTWANRITIGDSATTDSVHDLVTSSGGTAAETSTSYDELGRVLMVTDAEGIITHHHYRNNGPVNQITHAWGTDDATITKFTYDAAGRVTTRYDAYTSAEQAVTMFAYDGLGNVISTTDPNNKVTTQTFDRLGQLLTRTDPLGGVTSFQYDAFGNVVKTTDPRGNSSYNYYDALNRLIATRDAEDYLTHTEYTAFGEVYRVIRRANRANNAASVSLYPTVTIDARDAVASFEFDKLGRVTKTIDAEGYYEQYTLDAFGNRTAVRNKLGGIIINKYDRRGLLIEETLPMSSVLSDGSVQATSVTNKFEYDGRGNRTRMIEADGLTEQRSTVYEYDKLNRLVATHMPSVAVLSQSDHLSVTTQSPTTRYTYDGHGNVTMVWGDGVGGRILSYFDKLGRKTAEVGLLGTLKRWTYDAAGNVLTERVYGDVVAVPSAPSAIPPAPVNAANYRETVFTYDALNRLSTTSVAGVLVGSWNGSGVSPATQTITTTLSYDAAGNVTLTTDANNNTVRAWFDMLGRKTDQIDQEGYLTTWTYDAEGNVLTERRFALRWPGALAGDGTPQELTDTNDRTTVFEYDRNGRRTKETRTGVLAWSVNATNGAVTQTGTDAVVRYTYNGLGQVLTKQEATGDTVTYTYDDAGRLQYESKAGFTDYLGASVTPLVGYAYNGLNDLTYTRQYISNAGDRVTHYAYGAGGRLASVTDASGGVHNYAYDVLGNLVRDSYVRYKSNGNGDLEAILYTRDGLGRITAQVIAEHNGTSWTRGDSQNTEYNAWGEVSRSGLNGLWQESFNYNNRGLVEKTNSGDGVWRFFVYDANGNRALTVESEGADLSGMTLTQALALAQPGGAAAGAAFVDGINVAITTYDKRNMATETRLPQRELSAAGARESVNSSQGYNAFGEVVAQTDALGYTTTHIYNAMGRLIQKVMPSVSVTNTAGVVSATNPTEHYYYDLSGRLVATRDANGNLTSRTLLAGTGYGDAEALVTSEIHADGGIARTFYDAFGDARIVRNELNFDETRAYDAMGRVATIVRRTGLTEQFAYDLLGQRLSRTLRDTANQVLGTETNDYDRQGRVISTVDLGGDKTVYAYAWDATIATALGTTGGWIKTTTAWQQLGSANWKVKTETTDVNGLVTREVDFGNNTIDYTYDRAGRLTRKLGRNAAQTIATTLGYGLFNTGQIATVSDSTTGMTANTITSTFAYDAMGRRTAEKYSGSVYRSYSDSSYTTLTEMTGYVLQDAAIAYDALGRLTSFTNRNASGVTDLTMTQAYDAAGNIRRTQTNYPNLVSGGSASSDKWFAYDAMNRMVVANGAMANGQIKTLDVADARTLSYDVAGNRKTATKQYMVTENEPGTPSYTYEMWDTESYNYDADNQLTETLLNGLVTARTTRDIRGRVTNYTEYQHNIAGSTTTHDRFAIVYNARGQVESERSIQVIHGAADIDATVTNTYDAWGNLASTFSLNAGITDTSQDWTHAWWDGAAVAYTRYDKDYYGSNTIYRTDQYYDGLGRLSRAFIADGKARAVHYALNADGLVIMKAQSDNSSNDPDDIHRFVSGVQVAEYTNDAREDVRNYDYQALIGTKTSSASGSGRFYQGATIGTVGGEFGTSGYDPVNAITAGAGQASRSRYTVQAGDTLQSIARQLWGDSALWYRLAEANGLDADAPLSAGQSLAIPLTGPASRNNADMFRPYDTASAVGDLNPTSAKPPKKKGGMLGTILLAVIAVAVTIITSGAALAALSPAVGTIGTGIATVLGAAGAVSGVGAATMIAAGAIGGAIGSIVSQGVGVASGIQDKFSWKGVALSALAGGIGAGLGPSGAFGKAGAFSKIASPVAAAGLRGATASALTQGVGVATGLQAKFDWVGVAAAGIGAMAGSAVGGQAGGLGKFGQRMATSMASGIANAATRSLVGGTNFGDNILAALPDIIGQTIGGMIAGAVAGDPDSPRRVARRADDQFEPYLSEDDLRSPEFQAGRKIARAEFEADIAAARAANDPTLMRLARDRYADFYASSSPGFAAELSQARTLSTGPDLSRDAQFQGLAEDAIVVTGNRIPRGVAILPLVDPLSVEAGNIAINVGSAAEAAIDRVPGGRLAVTLVDVGLAIGGGPVRFAVGRAYEAGKDRLIGYATGRFADAGYGRDARAGGVGLPVLGSILTGGVGAGLKTLSVLGGITIRNGHLAGGKHPKTDVPFDSNGFPDFSAHAIHTVSIGQTGRRGVDNRAANAAAGLRATPKGYTWHHHQDGTTMQLIPYDLHRRTAHTGGVALREKP